MSTIVLASNNAGKVAEFRELFSPYGLTIAPQSNFNVNAVAETGLSFIENAILKARHAAAATGLPALADDSGLVVDALQGDPGIRSARYAGDLATATANINKLLLALHAETTLAKRTARFVCVLAYLRHQFDPMPRIAQGIWQGNILFQPQGKAGFGYDPIFYVPTHQCSAAELPTQEKNRISHRGQALQQLLPLLK